MERRVKVEIVGLSPLLMNRFPLEPIEGFDKMSPQEQAEHALYVDKDGAPVVLGRCLWRCFVEGGKYVKGKSKRKTVAAGLFIVEREIPLESSWVIDARPVVIPSTKGRIVRYRPRFDEWKLCFTLAYDRTLISDQLAREVIESAGYRVGLLDNRPDKFGDCGRFHIESWEIVDE